MKPLLVFGQSMIAPARVVHTNMQISMTLIWFALRPKERSYGRFWDTMSARPCSDLGFIPYLLEGMERSNLGSATDTNGADPASPPAESQGRGLSEQDHSAFSLDRKIRTSLGYPCPGTRYSDVESHPSSCLVLPPSRPWNPYRHKAGRVCGRQEGLGQPGCLLIRDTWRCGRSLATHLSFGPEPSRCPRHPDLDSGG